MLVAGGAGQAEVFDPATGRFTIVDGDVGHAHAFATAVRLTDGSVLICGGYDDGIHLDAGAWAFTTG